MTFRVNEGEIVSIVGPNGAGKTTLFNLLTGYLIPSSGEVRFSDSQVTRWAPHRLARLGMVRTFQQNELFKSCTALDNVLIGHHLFCGGARGMAALIGNALGTPYRRRKESEAVVQARAILQDVGIRGREQITADNLPHGDQRLLGIGIALAARPKLLLMDEPIGGMTANEADQVIELIYELRSRGITVLLIEHNMRVVMAISDRVIVLNQGVKIAKASPAVQMDEKVIEAYLGKWK